jgi:hypothetical protein
MENTSYAVVVAAAALLCACSGEDLLERRNRATPSAENGEGAESPPVCPGAGRAYVGIGGSDLKARRVDLAATVNRARVRPYAALVSDYERVVGSLPERPLETLANSFGETTPRWSIEPQQSAIGVYVAYVTAFDACLGMTASAETYAAAPTAASAATECTRLATKAWSRTPDEAEMNACVQLATVDSAAEPSARRRWASVCASIMTAAAALTY